MKTLTIAIATCIFFASCQKEIIVTPVDTRYETNLTIATEKITSESHSYDTSYAEINPINDDNWNIMVYNLPISGGYYDWRFPDVNGYFDFAYVISNDSIWGTGYVDQDTMYLDYSFQSLVFEDSYGTANVHSLYPY